MHTFKPGNTIVCNDDRALPARLNGVIIAGEHYTVVGIRKDDETLVIATPRGRVRIWSGRFSLISGRPKIKMLNNQFKPGS